MNRIKVFSYSLIGFHYIEVIPGSDLERFVREYDGEIFMFKDCDGCSCIAAEYKDKTKNLVFFTKESQQRIPVLDDLWGAFDILNSIQRLDSILHEIQDLVNGSIWNDGSSEDIVLQDINYKLDICRGDLRTGTGKMRESLDRVDKGISQYISMKRIPS